MGAVGSGAPLEAGDITFATRSDDGSLFYVDSNQDGVFHASEIVVDNGGSHGLRNRVGTVNLAAGTYAIAIPYYQGIGGAGMQARFGQGAVAEADFGTLSVIDPTAAAQAGLWTTGTIALEYPILADGNEVDRISIADPGINDLTDATVRVSVEDSSGSVTDLTQSALAFDGIDGHVRLPVGLADFTGGLTFEAWVKPTAVNTWARIFDFGNGPGSDNVLLTRAGSGQRPSVPNS